MIITFYRCSSCPTGRYEAGWPLNALLCRKNIETTCLLFASIRHVLKKTCFGSLMFWPPRKLGLGWSQKKNLTYPLKFCRHDTVGFLRQFWALFCMIITTKARNWALFRPEMSFPIWSMYSIFTYIWVIFRVNGGKYTIHGAFGFHYTGWFIGIPSWPLLMLPNIVWIV